MEGYAEEGAAASAELAAAGLAVLAGELTGLVSGLIAAGPVSFDEIERQVSEQGRELLRKAAQLVLDVQAGVSGGSRGSPMLPGCRGRGLSGGMRAPWCRGWGRFRPPAGVPGAGAAEVHPRDAVLNLPLRRYSWQVQQAVVRYVLAGAYEQARQFLLAAGITIGKQQLEQIAAEAARDAPGFYPSRPAPACAAGLPLALSADGKGVAMRPEARRRRGTKGPGQRVRTFGKRLGTGEKAGHKRMAETGCVFDVQPADGPPRTPEQIMTRPPGQAARGPQATGRWYTVEITASRAETISALFDQAERRDPGTPDLDRAGQRGPAPDRRHPRPGRHRGGLRHHPGGFHPRAGIPVEGRLVLPRPPRPGDGNLGHRAGPGHPARPGRRGHQPHHRPRRHEPAEAQREHRRSSPRPWPTSPPSSPTWTISAPSRTDGPSPPASSKAPAAT